MVRPTLYSISLTFKCKSTAVVLAGSLVVDEMVPWSRVCLSFPYAVCLGGFSEGFSEFWHSARNPQVQCDRAGLFGKTSFAPKVGEVSQK